MFKRKLRSALFIDYENVQLDADAIANVVAWLEDGEFDTDKRRRKLLAKHVYWNSSAEKHRNSYEAHGFNVVLCEKYANLKNGADIRMTMDMVEAMIRRPQIEEFILISKDSDFIPVMQRLGSRSKRTTVLVDESKPSNHTAFSQHADITIPIRILLGEGRKYVRPARGLFERLGLKRRAPKVAKPKVAIADGGAAVATPLPTKSDIDLAVDKVIKVASRNPSQSTGRQSITKELRGVPGFSTNGGQRYLGLGSYEALVREVAKHDQRITIKTEKLGGMSIVYVPGNGAGNGANEVLSSGPAFVKRAAPLPA